ncbi:BnaA02g12580D [Brassica napus]|uniref:(rape) hypothetical protein n=1 Tax=Brassica napus TaxID=3708 RepID=A0A078FE05_BRANA|nr:unnamed protein product [Brassica napus]CDY12590.1 BnaA02g12580D [Brassica napus]
MANNTSAPLLSQTEDKDTSSHFSFDKILEHSLSEFGLSQILQIILVGLASTFDSQQIFITTVSWDRSNFYSSQRWQCQSLESLFTEILYRINACPGRDASCRCLESHIFSDTLLGQLSISARLFPRLAVYCIFLYLFAVESPRWLHLQGKDEEAIEMLKKISPVNKGSGLSYYGVPLAVRDIKVNIYLSEALNAVVELPTFVITPILLEKFSRRSSVVVNCLIGGASGMLCFVLSLLGMTNTAFALELACFFCGRIQFNLMAVYMVELFPTCVRNTATLMLRQALVVAGACSPIIASIGRDVPSLSFALFGLAMAGLGLFALLLPETKGSSLCDTMEAQEERDRVFNTSQSFLK